MLADDVLAEYARDLWQRWRTYRALVDSGRLVLTQNTAFDEFERRLREVELERLVREEQTLAPAALRERNLRLLERLNPGRVFRIHMPVDEVVRRWSAKVRPEDHRRLDGARRLELVNLLLPTRLWVTELEPGVGRDIDALVARVPATPGAKPTPDLRAAYLALLARVSHGLYPVRDGEIAFDEFTAIYPVGTFNEYTTWNGKRIPYYPTPGRRTLTTHQRSLTVDHIPTDESYSYSPWLPYMHVGTNMHNSFHTLWWQMERGPHRVPAGGVAGRGPRRPRRQALPLPLAALARADVARLHARERRAHRRAAPAPAGRDRAPLRRRRLLQPVAALRRVRHRRRPHARGHGRALLRRLLAARQDARPLRAPMERRAYYAWLYAGDLDYDAADHGVFHDVRDGRFVGRSAAVGREYDHIALREAAYEPERVQFYRLVDIPFARELRKVSVRASVPGARPRRGR